MFELSCNPTLHQTSVASVVSMNSGQPLSRTSRMMFRHSILEMDDMKIAQNTLRLLFPLRIIFTTVGNFRRLAY